MEARTITQLHIFYLVLNTFGRCEDSEIVAISDERQKLVDFYYSQLLEEGYRDSNGFFHSFKEGILHNYNPPSCDITSTDWYGNGIHDEWVNEDYYYSLRDRFFIV